MRGIINYRQRAKQIKDYSRLRFGNITPTDIDGLIDYHGKGYILIELKLRDAPLSFGQKLALERLTDDLNKGGKAAICIIASHDKSDPEDSIDVANCRVLEYRSGGSWRLPRTQGTVKDLIKLFVARRLDKRIWGEDAAGKPKKDDKEVHS